MGTLPRGPGIPRKNCENGSSGPTPGICGPCAAVCTLARTLMLTTAGPSRSTRVRKSGSAASDVGAARLAGAGAITATGSLSAA